MSLEEHKTLIRRFYDEVWNRRNYAAAREFFADDGVRHEVSGPVRGGAEGIAQNAAAWCASFPDTQCNVEAVVAEGNLVVARWTIKATHQGEWRSIPATGRSIHFRGVNIYRIAHGKIAEIWNFRDDLGLFQQLGAVPALGQRHDAASRSDARTT
jgi:steroid delta-isomerase-like uncharacterized protein